MSHGNLQKWAMPGWRIEQKYAPGVLIGNWGEDRYTFQKAQQRHNSTHREDFRHFGTHLPDVIIRRDGLQKNCGLSAEQIFHHHGDRYNNNTVSWYDEHYNGRWRENSLPELRKWNSHTLAWIPEKSDYPLKGKPTSYGLLPTYQRRWKQQIANEICGDYQSTYQSSYLPTHLGDMVMSRHATARQNSISLYPTNNVNKNLQLRNCTFMKMPELVSLGGSEYSAPDKEMATVSV